VRTRYKVSFFLGRDGEQTPFSGVQTDCRNWANSTRNRLPDATLQELSATTNDERAWGLLLRHADANDDSVRWATELGIRHTADGDLCFTCVNSFGTADGVVVPMRRSSSRPRIVRDLLRQWGGRRGYPLHTTVTVSEWTPSASASIARGSSRARRPS